MEISLSDAALTIDGERTGAPETTEFYARERYYGYFRRRLKLPQGIDRVAISASFQNDLLEITVKGGVDHHEPERIQIEHASSGETSIRAR